MLGISFDTPQENKAFAEKFDFTFPLLCDTTREVGLAYGACDTPQDGFARRYTYVIDAQGVIEQAIDTEEPGRQAEFLLPSL